MNIYIDADALPVIAKELIIKTANRKNHTATRTKSPLQVV